MSVGAQGGRSGSASGRLGGGRPLAEQSADDVRPVIDIEISDGRIEVEVRTNYLIVRRVWHKGVYDQLPAHEQAVRWTLDSFRDAQKAAHNDGQADG